MCMDWMNGCRTPLMDGSLHGAFIGLKLGTSAAELYRALLEASAFGLRWIVELLRDGGVAIERFVATGGLPHHNPYLIQIYADVLGAPIEVHPSQHGCAVGAAVLGMLAAGPELSGFDSMQAAIASMAAVPAGQQRIVQPNLDFRQSYDVLYQKYRKLAETLQTLNA